jgi:hypothetical protein
MFNIFYNEMNGEISVEFSKKEKKVYKIGDVNSVNLQCKHVIMNYLSTTIKKMCDERMRALSYVYNVDVEDLRFFERVLSAIDMQLEQPTFKSYLFNVITKMYEHAPSMRSRYHENYIFRMKEIERVFNQYVKTDKYYRLRDCVQLRFSLM